MTQAQLAAFFGVEEATVSAWEQGRRRPSPESLTGLAELAARVGLLREVQLFQRLAGYRARHYLTGAAQRYGASADRVAGALLAGLPPSVIWHPLRLDETGMGFHEGDLVLVDTARGPELPPDRLEGEILQVEFFAPAGRESHGVPARVTDWYHDKWPVPLHKKLSCHRIGRLCIKAYTPSDRLVVLCNFSDDGSRPYHPSDDSIPIGWQREGAVPELFPGLRIGGRVYGWLIARALDRAVHLEDDEAENEKEAPCDDAEKKKGPEGA